MAQKSPPAIWKLLPGWPIITDGKVANSPQPRLTDIDQDNTLELIAVTGHGTVYICESSGNQAAGWPRNYAVSSKKYFYPDAFIADFFPLNPGMELGFYQILENGTSYFLISDLTGTILGEWLYPNMARASQPILLTQENHPPVMCFWNRNSTTSQVILHTFQATKTPIRQIIIDQYASLIRGNSFRDPITGEEQLLFVSSSNTIYHVNRTGHILHQWSHPSICVEDKGLIALFACEFEYEGEVTFFLINDSGQMLAWDSSGRELDSWHQIPNKSFCNLSFQESIRIRRFPIAADLNKDGIRELLTSWQCDTGLVIIFSAVGFPEFVLYSNGTPFYGWQSPLIADFNQDMTYELLVYGRWDGFRFFTLNGTEIVDYKVYPPAEIYGTVLLGDITGDNFCELFVTTYGGKIYAYTTPVVGRALWTESSQFYILNDFWDRDHDGLIDKDEEFWGTDPLSNDTDADGLTDYEEIGINFTDPLTEPSQLEQIFHHFILPNLAIIGIGVFVMGFGMSVVTILQIVRTQTHKRQRKAWDDYIHQNHLGIINIAQKAKLFHLSAEIADILLKESLKSESVEGFSGLYNFEAKLFLSKETMEWWLTDTGAIPLESLANSLQLPFKEVEHQIYQVDQVLKGRWIIKSIDEQCKVLALRESGTDPI